MVTPVILLLKPMLRLHTTEIQPSVSMIKNTWLVKLCHGSTMPTRHMMSGDKEIILSAYHRLMIQNAVTAHVKAATQYVLP